MEQQPQGREVRFSIPFTIEEEIKPLSEKDVEKAADLPRKQKYGTFVTGRRLRSNVLSFKEEKASSRILKAFVASLLVVGTIACCSLLILFVIG